ncbi:MAG: phytoene/squalene synthase family protein [Caldilinea sp. CFX5]|nr:phytoene/squalene synthase family protein [Caldilinea sp. CFX5]
MVIQTATWEYRLLAWASEALASPAPDYSLAPDPHALRHAYSYCKEITRTNSRTFHLASSLLPADKRRAVYALYAFCRSTDDLVDTAQQITNAEAVFANWRARLVHYHPSAHDPVPLAWADAQARYSIPRGYADQLIDGIGRDLRQNRYSSFGELTEYCYGVASTVGLMAMHIIGFRGAEALPYAVKLGIALQLTNILRDVGEDWRAGRLYLPLDELGEFGLSETDITAGRISDNWRAFMCFQIKRARQLYAEAQPGIMLLDADGRFAIAAAATLYRAILEDIEANDYDVFHRRAGIGAWGKIKRLPGIWWSRRG